MIKFKNKEYIVIGLNESYSYNSVIEIFDAISLETCVNQRNSYGGPSPEAVKVQIEKTKASLAEAMS